MFYQPIVPHILPPLGFIIFEESWKPPEVLFTPQEFWVFKDLESANKSNLEQKRINWSRWWKKFDKAAALLAGDFSKQTTKFYFATLNSFKHFKHFEIRDWDFAMRLSWDLVRMFISQIYFEGPSLQASLVPGHKPAGVRRRSKQTSEQ